MRRALVVAAVAALCITGCGSGDKPPARQPGLTAAQRAGLMTRLERVRAAATSGDRPLTQQRLRGFAREVARLQRDNGLDAASARALQTGAARALARAAVEVVPPPPAPAPTPSKKHDK